MSRAFVKETDQEPGTLAELEISPHPNLVTARGLAALEERVRDLERERVAARAAGDTAILARIARDLRYYQARRESARLVVPPADPTVVRFGMRVTLEMADGGTRAYRIVGEDEGDPAAGLISYVSPLARTLIGLEVGDDVPVGGGRATILAIDA
jgi:transcription elongation GreA/GreB family factor